MSENKRRTHSALSTASRDFWEIENGLVSPFTQLVSHFLSDKLPETGSNHNIQQSALHAPFVLLGDSKYPPYNIFKENDRVVVEIAVAGFKRSELTVTLTTNPDGQEEVTVIGKKEVSNKPLTRVYQHQGLAAREFKQRFSLGAYELVDGITHEDGILRIHAKRKQVEEPASRVLEIK